MKKKILNFEKKIHQFEMMKNVKQKCGISYNYYYYYYTNIHT